MKSWDKEVWKHSSWQTWAFKDCELFNMLVSVNVSISAHVYFLVVLEAGNFHEKQPKGKLSPEEEVRILRRRVEVIG
jgi:hypothetical protein